MFIIDPYQIQIWRGNLSTTTTPSQPYNCVPHINILPYNRCKCAWAHLPSYANAIKFDWLVMKSTYSIMQRPARKNPLNYVCVCMCECILLDFHFENGILWENCDCVFEWRMITPRPKSLTGTCAPIVAYKSNDRWWRDEPKD